MTSTQDISPEFDFTNDETLSGFRLHSLEVYNWGTFDKHIWTFDLTGKNALLTGDIGSGKSTLVDAVTTLLVPSQRIDYNKAAGAEKRERSLRSYVQGYYKNERQSQSTAARPVALRKVGSYSVILGRFYNQGYDKHVTLAQVFWLKDTEGQPARFYCTADTALSIKQNFSAFGDQISQLKRQLRKTKGIELHDTFPPYGAWFRRRFGIEDEQALDLFHQTVSMKSVGNLTDFVRQHMIEQFDVAPRITALINHFEDLNRAHESVLKAKAQIARLTPLIESADQFDKTEARRLENRNHRDSLRPYFASKKQNLLEQRLQRISNDQQHQATKLDTLHQQKDHCSLEIDNLKTNIAQNGGDRLAALKADIDSHEKQREKQSERATRFKVLLDKQQIDMPASAGEFATLVANLGTQLDTYEQKAAEADNHRTECEVDFRQGKEQLDAVDREIESLRSRESNISSQQVAIRTLLCEALNLDAENLPFAGELIQVRTDERDWRGTAERLLRNFGLSLLVTDEHYNAVSNWVNKTHLHGRLVFYRIKKSRHRPELPQLHPDSLVRKLEIKPGTGLDDWLEQELARRFDYACCSSDEQFRRESRAVTRNGLIKAKGERHEKDDRHRLDDKSRYILGWSNADKVAALKAQQKDMQASLQKLADKIASHKTQGNQLQEQKMALAEARATDDWSMIDWKTTAIRIDQLQAEHLELTRTSDILKQLSASLEKQQSSLKELESKLREEQEALGTLKEKHKQTQVSIEEAQAIVNEHSALDYDSTQLDTMRIEALGEHKLTVESIANRESDMRKWLQSQIDNDDRQIERLRERLVRMMTEYQQTYPSDTNEVDASLESINEYRGMLKDLLSDGLPRFEATFKELLNENTIREVANFQSQLGREQQTIRERIGRINNSLQEIDYNPSRYILLEAQHTTDAEIRDFQSELRACTEDSLTSSEDNQYSEKKFLQVKAIIERFKGREGSTELDRRWTRKVTDVREWFEFAASERWREDNTEFEHFADSGGKSGGQKEKLAYTVLAASLAYRFGLEWGAVRSKSFRFVVIDEAFGRGSDESADYGLKLFERLNLQLLIVTPLQKIQVIEPYVSSLGYVSNDDGKISRLKNMTIEEYRKEKEARKNSILDKHNVHIESELLTDNEQSASFTPGLTDTHPDKRTETTTETGQVKPH